MLLTNETYTRFKSVVKKYLKGQSDSAEYTKLFIERISENILREKDNTLLNKRIFLLENEDISIDNFWDENNKISDDILSEYEMGVLPKKTVFLRDIIPNVYVGIDDKKVSYANERNLEEEVGKILEEPPIFGEIDYAKTFLNINDELAECFGEKIFLYSALLNYKRGEIENTVYFKKYLLSFNQTSFNQTISDFIDYKINPLGRIKVKHNNNEYIWDGQYLNYGNFKSIPRENLTIIEYQDKRFVWRDGEFKLDILENWDNIREIFIKFLKNLADGTINY